MLKCKSGKWWEKAPYRARANNSVVLHRQETTKEEFDYIYNMCHDSNAGEPGVFWTNDYELGTNPCAEISLNSQQFCNLTSINQTGISNEKEFFKRIKAATIIGTIQAAYTNFPYLSEKWQTQTEKEALLEIDTNKKNRGVDVGILVFASIEQAPTQGKVLKFFPGNRIITVCDHGSETALYAAYACARQLAKISRAVGKIDETLIFRSIQEIMGHLEIETTINKEAKAIGAALDRLVSSALTARSKVLDALGKINL
jgi:hypothetical protein